MLWLVFVLLMGMALVGLFATYTLLGGVVQILLICAVAAFGIHRIWRMRAG
jgi:hypothetical protein